MANGTLSSGDLQFLKKLPANGKFLDKLFEGKGVFRAGVLIIRIIRLAKRGYLGFKAGDYFGQLPRCILTTEALRELVRNMDFGS